MKKAGALKYGPPQFFMSKGETMAAFRRELKVQYLAPLTRMKRVNGWRVVERFEVISAIEHGPISMLIYNNHQPKSKFRPFLVSQHLRPYPSGCPFDCLLCFSLKKFHCYGVAPLGPRP